MSIPGQQESEHRAASADRGPAGEGHAATNPRAPHDHDAIPTNLPRVSTPVVAAVLLVFLLVLAGLFALGYFPHRNRVKEAKEFAANQQDVPKVDVAQPTRRATAGDLVLPADTRATQETSLFPRTSGYLKKLYVDIGDRVKAGQLLAEIDTPEVDAQLNSARASLEQAKANVTKSEADLDLADKTVRRFESPAVANSVTPQDIDEKRSGFNQARAARDAALRASVGAAQAEVQRLTELQGFEKVTAPFAGVITARNYDLGALMSSSNSGDGHEIFRIAETDVLKVLANIPQTYVTSVKVGQSATLEVRNYPGRSFEGKLARSAGAVDSNTRTLRVEVEVPNPDGTLWAGMYGQLRFHITPAEPPLLVPTSALVFASDGTKVAVVEGGIARFKKIVVGRDLGTELEVADGLSGNEQVVTNPGERLVDGGAVEVVAKAPPGNDNAGRPREASAR